MPTQLNSTVESRRRWRCVLGITHTVVVLETWVLVSRPLETRFSKSWSWTSESWSFRCFGHKINVSKWRQTVVGHCQQNALFTNCWLCKSLHGDQLYLDQKIIIFMAAHHSIMGVMIFNQSFMKLWFWILYLWVLVLKLKVLNVWGLTTCGQYTGM